MKSIWLSKTFWVQIVTAILGAAEAMGGVDVIPAEYQGAFLIGLAVMNTVLRLMTDKGVRVL